MYSTQNNFNGGVVTAWIDTRSDLTRYRNSLRKCRNFLCTPYGALRRRMGSEFVALAGGKARLMAFQLGSLEGYILEFGNNYLRIHQSGERVGDLEILTPWSEEDVFSLQFVKINSVMFLAHPSHPPQQLRFSGGLNWTLSPMDFDYPAFAEAPLDGRTIAVTPDGENIATDSTSLVYSGDPIIPQISDNITVNGEWRVQVDTLTFTVTSPQYLKLQKSTDGGTNWSDVQSFSAIGSYSGTATGLLRLTSLEAEVDATLSADSVVAELGAGDTVVLTASSSVFQAGHIGSEFEVSHIPEESEERLSLSASGTSQWITVQGVWRLYTSGTWRGTVIVERSKDNGATSETILSRAGAADRNIVHNGKAEPEKVLMRIRYVKNGNSDNSPHATLETDGLNIAGRVRITDVLGGTSALGVVTSGIYSASPTDNWREAAWSNQRGWPAAIAWHEGRIWFGGTTTNPSTLWASKTDDFYNFEEGTNDDNGFQRTIATSELTNILWLASHDSLYIGTTGEEWRGTSESDSGVITPSSFILRRISNSGSDPIAPILAGSSIIHVQRQGRALFQISYDAASSSVDGYAPADLNQLAPHVTLGGIKSIAYQAIRDRIIWAVTGDGRMIGLTYDRQQSIAGWHEHDTQGSYVSVATVYEDGSEDSVYVSVERDGVHMIERMRRDQYDIIENRELIEGVFSDSAVIWIGEETDTIPGLYHLEGKEVQVVANGIYQGVFTVEDGAVVMDGLHTCAIVGLAFESSMETLPFTFEAGDGSASGRFKRVSDISLRVFRSIGGQVACTAAGAFRWQDMRHEWRKWVDTDAVPAVGDRGELEDWKIPVASGHDRDARAAVRITEPFPLNILSVTANIDFSP